MSFARVRERINQAYTDDFVDSVIEQFPRDLRHATLKGGRKGVARIPQEQDVNDEA